MKTVAVRHIERADADLASKLGAAGASTVHEAQGRIGLLKPYMRPIYPGAHIGPAGR
jgi:4-hydroxy-4-methyl-2-oxoglutarate aldolase